MENPVAKQMLIGVLTDGIIIKRSLTETESVKEQIQLLEQIREMFK